METDRQRDFTVIGICSSASHINTHSQEQTTNTQSYLHYQYRPCSMQDTKLKGHSVLLPSPMKCHQATLVSCSPSVCDISLNNKLQSCCRGTSNSLQTKVSTYVTMLQFIYCHAPHKGNRAKCAGMEIFYCCTLFKESGAWIVQKTRPCLSHPISSLRKTVHIFELKENKNWLTEGTVEGCVSLYGWWHS